MKALTETYGNEPVPMDVADQDLLYICGISAYIKLGWEYQFVYVRAMNPDDMERKVRQHYAPTFVFFEQYDEAILPEGWEPESVIA